MLRGFHIGRILFYGTPGANSAVSSQFKIHIRELKVCVLGANGSIGQPLSLMVKQSPWFEEAALYDVTNCRGLAVELNHIDTPCLMTSYEGEDGLKEALKGSNIVLNTTGITTKPGMTSRDDLFDLNACLMYKMARDCAQYCPQAFHLILTNPLNSMLPIACKAYQNINGCLDPAKIFGVTTIDVLRAATYVADITQMPPETVRVPVIGGHSGSTIIPLLSKTEPCVSLSTEEVLRITKAVQYAANEVIKAKEMTGSATLSVAYGTIRFAEGLAKAIFGEQGIIECSYVMSNLIPDVKYFASPLILGPSGVQKILPLPELSNYEECLLETAVSSLKKEIEKGERFALT